MRIETYEIPAQPSAEVQGKFVQLVWGGEEYLIFTPFSLHRFHVEILKHFLDKQAIPYKQLNQEHLLIKESNLNVIGGGRFRLDYPNKILELFGDSQAYGRFNDVELDRKISQSRHDWKELTVRIGFLNV